MVINKTLPRLIGLLILMVIPILVGTGAQENTMSQEEQQKQEQLKKQQEQQRQQQAKQQQEQQRQQQLKQQQEQQRQEQVRQQQEQQRQQQLKQQQEQQRQQQAKQQQEEQRQQQQKLQQEQQRQEQVKQQDQQRQQQLKQQQEQQRQEQGKQQQEQQRQEQLRQAHPGQQTHPVPGGQPGEHLNAPKVLSTQESQQTISTLNQNRARLGGINSRPLPVGRVTSLPNGHHIISTSRGATVEVRSNGALQRIKLANGRGETYHANGRIDTVRAPGIEIHHGLRGERTIVTESNGQRLVSEGPQRGYVERPYINRDGREYVQRTYWEGARSYARVYWDHPYRGVHYYQYEPVYYYHPRFYGWAYDPWAAPVRYRWTWWGDPWRHYYGAYFVPEPEYHSGLWWLTDFLIAEDLSLAYQARLDAEAQAQAEAYQPEAQGPPPENENPSAGQLSPEMKAAIQAEVQRKLAAERAEANQPPPPNTPAPAAGPETPPTALDPTHRLFVVSSNLSVSTADGQECELTGGDLITRLDDTPGDDGRVRVSVMTSKQQDCSVGSTPLVGVNDLQEMHNTFHAQVDSGLGNLSAGQGQNGLPPAPDPNAVPGEVPPPAPDANVAAQLTSQQTQATQAENQVQQEVQAEQSTPNQ